MTATERHQATSARRVRRRTVDAVAPRPRAVAVAALRAVVVVVFLAPLAFMISGSLRRVGAPPPDGFEAVPTGAGLTAYRRLGEEIALGTALRNSALVVAVAVPVTVLVASWAGFALSQFPRRSRRLVLGLTLVTLMVPLPMVWVARFVGYLKLGLLDTLVPLMAPALAGTTPFTVLLSYRAFRRVPPELFEAARAEGASAFRTWWRVGLPLVGATTTAIAAIAFTVHWGSYLDALLFVRREANQTLPLGVGQLVNLDPSDLPVMLAGAVVLSLPPVLALFLAQRRLLASVDLSAG
ncbi:MAG: multiple sugar transport system permease protein [Frankiaceae bacterium]|nr:multiple sugar transport system permease protein [Frankiaceae bacterium]